MKTLNKFLYLLPLAIVMLACNLTSALTPSSPTSTSESPAAITATVVPVVPTIPPPSIGQVVSLNNVTLTIPQGVADGASAEMLPASTDPNAAPWEIRPAHLEFTLTNYQLQGKFHQPRIYVIPAEEYASQDEGAAENIQFLKDALGTHAPSFSNGPLPHVPFFNAAQVFAAQIQPISFQTGSGVRFLTEYAQYSATVNNRDMFYHFQGLTIDGKYYIIAILPVTSSILAEDEKPESPVPSGGVPVTPETGPDQTYYEAVTQALNAVYPDSFNPSLFQLDDLIQSITVTP